LIRGAWPLRASFLILTSVYEDQEAKNRRKWMPPASGPSHSRSPRHMGSFVAHSLARESASRSLAQEGGVAAARRKGTGTRKASRIDAESVCLVQLGMPGSTLPMGHRQNTTSTCTFGVGPPGLEGPVRRPSSNPPRAGPVRNIHGAGMGVYGHIVQETNARAATFTLWSSFRMEEAPTCA